MASNALPTQGISVAVETTPGGGTYIAIAEVTGFAGPTTEANEIEVTTLASTTKEFIAGLADNGEVTMEVNAVPSDTQHNQVRSDIIAGTTRSYQIDFADGSITNTTYTFDAFVKSFPFSAAADDKLAGTITLRISGDIVIALAT